MNLISSAKVHKHKVNRRNFPNSTSQQFDNSSHSSNQTSIAQIDDEDDIKDSNIDIEEIMQQIIALKDVNFEQISNTFPSLRRLLNSAEKHTVQNNETSLTQFSKMFPSTSNGPPTLSINSSPVSNWLSNLTKELKSFFEALARKSRADARIQNETQQRIASIEQWIRGAENCTSTAMDSESQQIGLLKFYSVKLKNSDERTTLIQSHVWNYQILT